MMSKSIPKTNRKFWLMIFSLTSLVIAAGGYWYYTAEEQEIRKEKSKELTSIALVKVQQIAHWRADRYSDAEFHFRSPLFHQAVERFIQNPSNPSLRSQLMSRLQLTKKEQKYHDIFLVSASGTVMLSLGSPADLGAETISRTKEAIAKQEIIVSDLFLHSASRKLFMDFIVPLGTNASRTKAALILRTNPENDLYPLVEWWPLAEKTNETLIIRRDGDSVTFLSNQRFQTNGNPLIKKPLSDTLLPSVKAALGKEGICEGIDYRGKRVLSNLQHIPNSPWSLVVKADIDDLYADLRYRGWLLVIVLALLIIATAGSTGFALYYRQRNLYRERLKSEMQLRELNEEFRTILYSIGDAVITTDTEGKIRQMNAVAEQLTGWKERQAVDMPVDEVFVIHNEETGAPAENPVHRVLREGTVAGLANHTVLVAKDGTNHPISDSGAPIFDRETKSIKGVVLVFRDQTEERRTQKALRESEEKFKQLFEAESDAIILVDSFNGNILEANTTACSLYQYSRDELLTMTITDISAELEKTQRVLQETKRSPEHVFSVPLRYHKKKNGAVFPVEVTGRFFNWRGSSVLIAAIRDISERVKAEEMLQKNASLVRASQQQAHIGSYELDIANGRWTSSETLDEIFGIPETFDKSVEGWGNIIHPDDREMMLKYFAEEVIGARGKFHREYRIIRQSDQAERWVLGIGTLIFDAKNNPVKMIGVIQDITERKQYELKLKTSEESYRGLFNSVQDAIYIQDVEGRFLDVNDGAVAMYGYPREYFIGKTPEFLSAPGKNNLDHIASLIQKAFQGIPQQFEFWGKRANGEIFPKEVRLYKGSYFGQDVAIAVAQDISERKQADEILRASEERYRKLIDASPDAIAITDMQGNILFASSKSKELFGQSTDKPYVGINVLNWIVPEHHEKALKGIRDMVRGKANGDNQYKLLREDGTIFIGEINAAPLLDASGNPEGMVALIRDITRRKQAEEFLRKFSLVVDQSPASVVITDKDGAIEYVNQKFTEVTGYHRQEILGKNPRIFKSGLTPQETYKEMWNSLNEGKEWKGILCNRKKNGELFWEDVYITPLYDEEGALVNFVALKEDITAQRKMTEEKASLEEQLRQVQKLESIGTLASGIAHDFNNILGIIMAHVSILERLKDDHEKYNASIETIFRTINRGAALVKQILTFARKTSTNLEYVNVNKTISDIQKMLTETFPKTISIKLQLEKALPIIMVDSTQFNQSILNLCVNARDAMNDEGTIQIATRLVDGSDIAAKFPGSSGKHFVSVSVRDSGVGINEAMKDKIFEPFFTTKEKGKGTGLGLSVVFGVMQNHNGFVDLESEVGKGAAFTLYFPIPEGNAPQYISAEKSQRKITGGTETILFVEDEESLIEIAVMMLKGNGYTVLTAKNGEEGYQLYSRHRDTIDLVVSDVGMPVMSGEKMYGLIKRINPSVKIIFATGYIEPSVKEQLMQKGAHEFIQKPYDASEFLRKVREVLDKDMS
jgi:two-component system cell cycle sensor histidine kinase/response regulator CckA